MKAFLWMFGGICAAGLGILALGPRRTQPVNLLARQLEAAWADNHTVI